MLAISRKIERLVLLVGDVIFFYLALWVTLAVRYLAVPDTKVIVLHLVPFSVLFVVWVLIFYVAGLYDKKTTLLRGRLPSIIVRAQSTNILLAAAFFFFVPLFSIAPKTNLFIYLVVSSLFIFLWRVYASSHIGSRRSHAVIVVAGGQEAAELTTSLRDHFRTMNVTAVIDPELVSPEQIIEKIDASFLRGDASVVILDVNHPRVQEASPRLYDLVFSDVRFVSLQQVYEDLFDKVPVSLLGSPWSLASLAPQTKLVHDSVKRIVDVAGSFLLGIVTLVLLPVVVLAIKLDDGGPVFLTQYRVGQYGKRIRVLKFRSMATNEDGVWPEESENQVTRVGAVLRKTRIDELPQLWSIFTGDLSLIGPRPDIEGLAKRLAEAIPYYNVRYLIKPGVTGWAQVKQDIVPHSVEETKERLAYDLYYLKHRSFLLDMSIALRTIKTLVSRSGR